MLRVEGLERRAGGFRLRIDEWTVNDNRYLVIVGPSGAGKTMLLETVAGLNHPDAGHIWIDGRDVTRLPPEARGVGFVYQDCWLFPHLTVQSNIDFGRRYHKSVADGPTTDALADMLHIQDLLDRKPPTLSGGERQRVALARALAIRPRLLFLDEPLGTLDPVTREHVAAELMSCHRTFGMTTIHVTHDHSEARMMGDSIAVILDGRLEQSGKTEDVFRQPRTSELAAFLGCENVIETVAEATDTAGSVRIRLGDRSYEVASTQTGRVGVCIRPEDVVVEPTNGRDDASATMSGSMTDVSPRGPMTRLVIDVSGQHWVSLISQSQRRQHRFEPGDAVTLQVPDDAWHLIPLESDQ